MNCLKQNDGFMNRDKQVLLDDDSNESDKTFALDEIYSVKRINSI